VWPEDRVYEGDNTIEVQVEVGVTRCVGYAPRGCAPWGCAPQGAMGGTLVAATAKLEPNRGEWFGSNYCPSVSNAAGQQIIDSAATWEWLGWG
jgi:hypothetical protein